MRFPFLSALVLAATLTAQVEVGGDAPEFEFDSRFNFGDMQAQKLSQLRGSAVLLEFWGTH